MTDCARVVFIHAPSVILARPLRVIAQQPRDCSARHSSARRARLYVMGGMTGTDGSLLVCFSTEFHNRLPRWANCPRRPSRRRAKLWPLPPRSVAPAPRSAKMRPATRTEQGIHRRKCRWDAIATEHASAGELGVG